MQYFLSNYKLNYHDSKLVVFETITDPVIFTLCLNEYIVGGSKLNRSK